MTVLADCDLVLGNAVGGVRAHLTGHILVLVVAEAVGLVQVVHGAVIGVHELVLESLCVRQVPSPPALLEAAPVPCNSAQKLPSAMLDDTEGHKPILQTAPVTQQVQ